MNHGPVSAGPARRASSREGHGGAGAFRVLSDRIRELWRYREFVRVMVHRDLLVRYKQSLIGAGWALFVPLANMLVFTVLFTRVVTMETDQPYPLFVYAGLLPWLWLASALNVATSSLTQNMALVTRLYFPREILPASAVVVTLVDFLLGGAVLAVLMVAYGVSVGPELALLPVVVLVQLFFTLGLGLLLAMGNLFFRDVRYLMGVLVGIWMFVTPVLYPLDRIGGRLQAVLAYNPMASIIEAYRWILLDAPPPPAGPAVVSVASAAVLLVGGWMAFRRMEPRFAEVI